VATIWRAHELLDLGTGANDPGWTRIMNWVLALQGKPAAGFDAPCAVDGGR